MTQTILLNFCIKFTMPQPLSSFRPKDGPECVLLLDVTLACLLKLMLTKKTCYRDHS